MTCQEKTKTEAELCIWIKGIDYVPIILLIKQKTICHVITLLHILRIFNYTSY